MTGEKSTEYLALARKYRPQNFADVAGQGHVVSALANSIDARRLHHAYLFTGTRGVGKTTIARIIAKSLQCEKGISSKPCGECGSCRAIVKGAHTDVIEIDAASQTKVDDTRALLENTRYPPLSGRYKIYIIDEVHMLSNSSFNALLKTLEEPPAYVKFILATTDPQKIPATVLSRCLKFQLKSLSVDEIKKQIELIAQKEGISCESDGVGLIARAARGSMRDALSMCDQAIALGNGSIKRQAVLSMLGTASDEIVESILALVEQSSQGDFAAVLDNVTSVSPNYRSLLEQLYIVFHDIALYQMMGGSRMDLFTFPKELLDRHARAVSGSTVQLCYQIALEGLNELRLSSDPRTSFEMTLLRLLAFVPVRKKL